MASGGGGRRPIDQVRQIPQAPQLLEPWVGAESIHQQSRLGEPSLPDDLFHGAVEPLVERLEEVLRPEITDTLIGGVVEQDRAQKGLLGL